MTKIAFVESPEEFWIQYQEADAALLTANYWGYTWAASVNCPLYPIRIRNIIENELHNSFRYAGNGAVVSSVYSNTRWRTTYYALASEWGRINLCQFRDFMTKLRFSGVFTRPRPRVIIDTYVPMDRVTIDPFLEIIDQYKFPGTLFFYQNNI